MYINWLVWGNRPEFMKSVTLLCSLIIKYNYFPFPQSDYLHWIIFFFLVLLF